MYKMPGTTQPRSSPEKEASGQSLASRPPSSAKKRGSYNHVAKNLLSSGLGHTSTENEFDIPSVPVSWGARMADKVTDVYGSWPMFWCYMVILLGWIVLNTVHILRIPIVDAYPFTFLNLILSVDAAVTPIFILMSQNQSAIRDQAVMKLTAQTAFRLEVQMASIEVILMELASQIDNLSISNDTSHRVNEPTLSEKDIGNFAFSAPDSFAPKNTKSPFGEQV